MLVASTGWGLLAATTAPAGTRDDPYEVATWEALAGSRLVLRAAAGKQAVVAQRPRPGAGGAFTVVLAHENTWADAGTLPDGTYELEHDRTGRFPLFVVNAGPGRYVATFNT
jgi:hypothetical protein